MFNNLNTNIPSNYKPKNYIVKKLPLSKQTTIDDHLAGIDKALENINSDISYSGSTQIFTANENFLFGEVGFISNNRIIKSSAQSEVLGNCNVIALSDIRLGRRGLFGLYGCKVKNINWNFNLGQIFLSLTNGNITQDLNDLSTNNVNLPVGTMIDTNILLFLPSDTPITLK